MYFYKSYRKTQKTLYNFISIKYNDPIKQPWQCREQERK